MDRQRGQRAKGEIDILMAARSSSNPKGAERELETDHGGGAHPSLVNSEFHNWVPLLFNL